MTSTQEDEARATFLADAKATASRAGLTVPERLAYVAAEAERYARG
jgi:1,2-phenylacetyl-CoA epoxidase catalytic subunit